MYDSDLGLSNTASIVIACIVASVLSLVCGLAIGVCSTCCCMRSRARREQQEDSQVARPIVYEEIRNRASTTETIELDGNKASGPIQHDT